MKQIGSVITGSPNPGKTPQKSTGTQPGETGAVGSATIEGPKFASLVKAWPNALHKLRPPMSKKDFANHVLWIDGRVRTALSHFPGRALDAQLADAAISDWTDALVDFATETITEAFSGWIKTEKWKPSPAEIRTACFKIVQEAKRGNARHPSVD